MFWWQRFIEELCVKLCQGVLFVQALINHFNLDYLLSGRNRPTTSFGVSWVLWWCKSFLKALPIEESNCFLTLLAIVLRCFTYKIHVFSLRRRVFCSWFFLLWSLFLKALSLPSPRRILWSSTSGASTTASLGLEAIRLALHRFRPWWLSWLGCAEVVVGMHWDLVVYVFVR